MSDKNVLITIYTYLGNETNVSDMYRARNGLLSKKQIYAIEIRQNSFIFTVEQSQNPKNILPYIFLLKQCT